MTREATISILLIEDEGSRRTGLAASLDRVDGLALLRPTKRLEVLRQGPRPDVVLVGVGEGVSRPLDIVHDVGSEFPQSRLIAMGVVALESDILGLVREGVCGFVLRDASWAGLLDSIRAVAAGCKVLPAPLLEPLFEQIVESGRRRNAVWLSGDKMTSREREIVELIADGLSNKEIGNRLCISPETVKSHVHHILGKLSLRSRVEVATRARDRMPSDG